MLTIQWALRPELFSTSFFSLRYYSLCFLIAFVLGYRLMAWVFDREQVDRELLDRLTVYIFVGTLLGARLGHCLFYDFDYYKMRPWEIILPFSWNHGQFVLTGYQGLASHGGAIGILISLWLYCRKYKVRMGWLLDRLVLPISIAAFFIRVGNFFNSEIIGKPTRLPWAVVFARVDAVPRHPAQLYEALAYLLIFFSLWRLYLTDSFSAVRGRLLGAFLVLVFTARFLIEFVKIDQSAFEDHWTLNMGQWLSIPFIVVGILLLIMRQRGGKEKDDDAEPVDGSAGI